MTGRLVPWIVVGGLGAVLFLFAIVDTTNVEPPPTDPNVTLLRDPEPEIGPVQERIGESPGFYRIAGQRVGTHWIAMGVLYFGGLAVPFFRSNTTESERRTLVSLAILGAIAMAVSLQDFQALPDPESPNRHDPYVIPLAQTLALLGACAFVALWTHMDGFSQGSLVVLGILQLFVLWGWFAGGRSYVYHTNVTIGVLVLVASILLFHQFQEERRAAAATT